jgi:hypothetical protein
MLILSYLFRLFTWGRAEPQWSKERQHWSQDMYRKGKRRGLARFKEAMTGLWLLRCGHDAKHWDHDRLCCKRCEELRLLKEQEHDCGERDIGGEG